MSAFHLEPWHWWAVALILVVIEALFPSGLFACMAVSAAITGAISQYFAEIGWQPLLAIFATLTVTTNTILRLILGKRTGADTVARYAHAKEQLGQTLTLLQPIQNGFGEIEINGVHWELKGPDTRSGVEVRVIAVDGDILSVMPVKRSSTENATIE